MDRYWLAFIRDAINRNSTVNKNERRSRYDDTFRLPLYFLTILGIWKVLGVVAVLMPKFPLLKEWAYAGFFFAMSGAVFSHVASGDGAKEFFGPVLLIILTVVSWYFRSADRKMISVN